MELTPKEMRNSRFGPFVVKNLEKRNFEACYVKTGEEALCEALKRIPEGSLVSWGGSLSIRQIGLPEALKAGNYRVLDRDRAADIKERQEIMRQALLCDVFLSSSNAITEDGVLVNVDGGGNRVAAITFGPKRVLIIAGMNKIVPSVEDGIERIRSIAAPVNMMRFVNENTNTPCARTGRCGNCNTKDTICNYWVVTKRSMVPGRIHVILVGEDLGY